MLKIKFNIQRPALPFSKKLFLTVISLLFAYTICFIAFQYHREKQYKIDMLSTELQDFNKRMHESLRRLNTPAALRNYVNSNGKKDLRLTIISHSGQVVFDSYERDDVPLPNHADRPEIKEAITKGFGNAVRRYSATTGMRYFYSATLFSDCIIRSALPYNVNLIHTLQADNTYIWFSILITLVLVVLFFSFSTKLSTSINQLRSFASQADHNAPIDTKRLSPFPHNELGEISQHIIQMYNQLHETKEALYIEREKLITHLQISHEGLGVFSNEKKEILVNNLFLQYMNLISDENLEQAEDVFSVNELNAINEFIDKRSYQMGNKNESRTSLTINKNGKTFYVECIVFQDRSFEIDINDITVEEEQIRLKRQLTQNIAHELKTPVSSIQGYLETIVNNKDIDEEKKDRFLQHCYAQSNRLSRLLADISTLTRMDEAASFINIEEVDISKIVKNMLEEVSLQLEEKGISVHNNLPEKMPAHGNHSLLYSIFRNLTDNAIAYAGENITITINCFREDEEFYYFSFADNGVGVPSEHLNRLFERFYRIDKGRSRKLGGTGLGLAIVKNAVLLHGGSISAKSTPGGGLEFLFTIHR